MNSLNDIVVVLIVGVPILALVAYAIKQYVGIVIRVFKRKKK